MAFKRLRFSADSLQKLKNKRVLITAGPTWVAIDKVRVISNSATGQTGLLLAERLRRLGARVTLLLGPVESCFLSRDIKVIRFRFFDELREIIRQQIKNKIFDIVIHSAAVSDYQPVRMAEGKISSGYKTLNLKLVPTAKLARLFQELSPESMLVIFKLELNVSRQTLIKRTLEAMKAYSADVAVANTFSRDKYRAFVLGDRKIQGPLHGRAQLAEKLIKVMGKLI